MDRAEQAGEPWREPARGGYPAPDLLAVPGVDQVRAFLAGDAPSPPIGRLTGMGPTEVGLGSATFTMPASPWLLSPQGLISVGTLAILADGPLGCAVQSALPANTGYATSELSLRMLRPARADGKLLARGALVHSGRTLALSSVQIVDGRGRLLADGSSMCPIRPVAGGGEGARQPPEPPSGTPDPFERPPLGAVLEQDVWDRMDGRSVLEAQLRNELPHPPLSFLTGVHPVEVGDGEAVFAMPCHEWLCSPLATILGGAIAMVADCALASAIQTTAGPATAMATMDLKVNFVRPVLPDGRELRARGRVRHAGRTIRIAEAEVFDADGKAVALATGSAMLLEGRPAALGGPDD